MKLAVAGLMMSIALVAAGCSTSDDAPETSASPTTAGGTGAVTVPDAYTGLILTPIGDPTFPFPEPTGSTTSPTTSS